MPEPFAIPEWKQKDVGRTFLIALERYLKAKGTGTLQLISDPYKQALFLDENK